MHVTIRGDGIAARCCERLLAQGDFDVTLQRPGRLTLPTIMVGTTTQKLFRDAFGQDDLFAGAPVITTRVVAWGRDADPLPLPHTAVVVTESDLLQNLQTGAEFENTQALPSWTIYASRPLPDTSVEMHFGSRTAHAVPVRLRKDAPPSACWIESLENGWAFLLPGQPVGWLLLAGEVRDLPPEGSRLVAAQIAGIAGEPAEFPCYPRIAWPLCGPGWLACGTSALAFDPLCGDGSGHAIREAILASAVLRAVEQGGDCEELLAHYRSRLLAGFQRHLQACEGFYQTGGGTRWWQTQLEAVRGGLAWCARELRQGPGLRYQLRGFDLEPVNSPG